MSQTTATVPGSFLTTNQMASFVRNTSLFFENRSQLNGPGLLDPEGRNLNADCGYPSNPTVEFYDELYRREGIPRRVVDVYPDECWAVHPTLTETRDWADTPFELAFQALLRGSRVSPWHFLHRVDRLSGIGSFGILLLGLDDGLDLSLPVRGFTGQVTSDGTLRRSVGQPPERKLIYLRAFAQPSVQIEALEDDCSSPRYGEPLGYKVRFNDPSGYGNPVSGRMVDREVHWTRVVHVADNRGSSEVFGCPRQEPVLNREMDLRKILSGSAEIFWKNAGGMFAFEAYPEAGDADLDEDSIREQFLLMFNRLQRYMSFTGGSVKSLAPPPADPSNQFAVQVQAICAAIKCPVRVFLGSEAAHLASTQDIETWNKRLRHRQVTYLDPMVIRPFVDRLVDLEVLPTPRQYQINWKDLNVLTDQSRSDVAVKMTQALLQYVTSGAEKIMPLPQFLTLVLRYSDEEAAAVADAVKNAKSLITEELWSARAGLTSDTRAGDPARKTGALGRRNGQSLPAKIG